MKYGHFDDTTRKEISDLHKCEPYVYAQTIAGKDAATQERLRTLPGSAQQHDFHIETILLIDFGFLCQPWDPHRR